MTDWQRNLPGLIVCFLVGIAVGVVVDQHIDNGAEFSDEDILVAVQVAYSFGAHEALYQNAQRHAKLFPGYGWLTEWALCASQDVSLWHMMMIIERNND